ncbi:hypothetical protein AAG906_035620 [Vitis piasezkii]
MVLRSLQPRIAKHVVGVPFTDFGLWIDSSPSDVKGKKPFGGQRLVDVSAISSSNQRPPRRHQPVPQLLRTHPSYVPHQYRSRAPRPTYDQTYMPQTLALPYYAIQGIERPPVSYTAMGQPCYAAQFVARPTTPYPRPRAQQTSAPFALRTQRQFSRLGMLLSQALRKLIEPPPQPIPPQFRMDLDCAYHQGPRHETDHCIGLVHLGHPSVTTNPLPAHTTHVVPPPTDSMHSIDFVEFDDHICMLSWDDSEPEPIVSDGICEMSGVTLGPRMPYRRPLTFPHYSVQTPFVFLPDVDEVQAPHVDDVHTSNVQYVIRRGMVVRQQPPAAARPLEVTSSQEKIRVETTTTLEGLIHMVTVGRATCIVFSDDDLPSEGSSHTRPLYISIGCSGRRVPSVLLDNGSALNVSGPFLIPFIRSHSDDDLLLTGFTFDEVQTLEIEDLCRDFVAMSFDQHSSTVVLDMMMGMSYLPSIGLERHQHGPSEFMAFPDHDERVRVRLTHTPFDYPVRPYTLSLTGYFVRALEPQAPSDGIIGGLSTTQETKLQRLVQ